MFNANAYTSVLIVWEKEVAKMSLAKFYVIHNIISISKASYFVMIKT